MSKNYIDLSRLGKMEPAEVADDSIYVEATPLQLKHIELMFEGFLDFIRSDELFEEGVPDMTFSVSKYIRVG